MLYLYKNCSFNFENHFSPLLMEIPVVFMVVINILKHLRSQLEPGAKPKIAQKHFTSATNLPIKLCRQEI